jgi:hypothetical protein
LRVLGGGSQFRPEVGYFQIVGRASSPADERTEKRQPDLLGKFTALPHFQPGTKQEVEPSARGDRVWQFRALSAWRRQSQAIVSTDKRFQIFKNSLESPMN